MNIQRRKEVKYLVGTVASILFGIVGFMLALATIIPQPEVVTDNDYYIVGITSSLIFLSICAILFRWSKKQLD